MTILPLYHNVKEPDKNNVPPSPSISTETGSAYVVTTNNGGGNTMIQSDAQILIPQVQSKKKKKGCLHKICPTTYGSNRSMWITVGFLTFAFLSMMLIQNVIGYLAYNGIGVRNDYGIVLDGGSMSEGVAFTWPHIPWKCSPGKLSPIQEENGDPVIFKHSPGSQLTSDQEQSMTRMDKLRPLLINAAFHIPKTSHKDATVFIVGGGSDQNDDTEKMDENVDVLNELRNQIKSEFNFDMKYVHKFDQDLGAFFDNAQRHLSNLIKTQCHPRPTPDADD